MTESSSAVPYKKRDSTEIDQGKVLDMKEETSPRKHTLDKAKFLARLASMPAMQKLFTNEAQNANSPDGKKSNRNSINASTPLESPKPQESKSKVTTTEVILE